MKVADWPLFVVSVTAVPLCSAFTSFRALSAEHAMSANCVETRSTTTGPCASSCWTNVVTWVSVVVDVIVFWLDPEMAPVEPTVVVEDGGVAVADPLNEPEGWVDDCVEEGNVVD